MLIQSSELDPAQGGKATAVVLILPGQIFAAKHSCMRNSIDRWWQTVPWGWILVSAYCTALLCVGISQIAGQANAVTFVRDYQTLLAGIATIAALLIAVQQLKRQANRDAVDAHRHHQTEVDALDLLGREAESLSRASVRIQSQYAVPLSFEKLRWERLRSEVHVTLAPKISRVIEAVGDYNSLLSDPHNPFMAFNRVDEHQLGEAGFTLHQACRSLLVVVTQRRREVAQMIEDSI